MEFIYGQNEISQHRKCLLSFGFVWVTILGSSSGEELLGAEQELLRGGELFGASQVGMRRILCLREIHERDQVKAWLKRLMSIKHARTCPEYE